MVSSIAKLADLLLAHEANNYGKHGQSAYCQGQPLTTLFASSHPWTIPPRHHGDALFMFQFGIKHSFYS